MSAKISKVKKKVGPIRVILRVLGGLLAALLLVLLGAAGWRSLWGQ